MLITMDLKLVIQVNILKDIIPQIMMIKSIQAILIKTTRIKHNNQPIILTKMQINSTIPTLQATMTDILMGKPQQQQQQPQPKANVPWEWGPWGESLIKN